MNAKILECTKQEYDADPCPPSLSASIAHRMDKYSPLHAYLYHPRLGGLKTKPKKEFDMGSLIHAMILGEGMDWQVLEANNYRTKVAQEQRDHCHSTGIIPVLPHEMEQANEVCTVIEAQLKKYGIELKGSSEVKIAWQDKTEAGALVQCRSALDHLVIGLPQSGGHIYDLKTTYTAHPAFIARHILNMSGIMQLEAYPRAVAAIWPERRGLVDFTFIYCEVNPPYCVVPVGDHPGAIPISGMMKELARLKWQRAVERWHECLTTNQWPGYEFPVCIDAPTWSLKEHEEEQFTADFARTIPEDFDAEAL